MQKKIYIIGLLTILTFTVAAQHVPAPIKRFLQLEHLQGSSFSLQVKDVSNGEVLYSYDENREVIPASVLKLVTTATALELLGDDYRFETSLEYDGEISGNVLHGNLYIKGSGDPTLGSSHFSDNRAAYTPDKNTFIPQWLAAVQKAGIEKITGSLIADESIFDTEGISPKWLYEDMGSYYGAGCYGINVFDNLYKLYISTGDPGNKPNILRTDPLMTGLNFRNYLTTAAVPTDSSFIIGGPFSNDRFLYGVIPSARSSYILRGDIPDPALFLAQYTTARFKESGIGIEGSPITSRILAEQNRWHPVERQPLVTTYSPPLRDITRVINERSHNLFSDALLKTLGLLYASENGEVLSSSGKGVKVVNEHWKQKGFDTSSLWMYDGNGIAHINKISAGFLTELLCYMTKHSPMSAPFTQSLPKVGAEGSVANFLKGTPLQGKAVLKSGSMNRVRCYGGYIYYQGKQYAIALFVNNYSCDGKVITKDLEKLLVSLFP